MSMAFLPEEDAATIPPEQAAALVEAGVLSPAQPGLQTTTQGTQRVTEPEETVTPTETETERIARLDREAANERARLDRQLRERELNATQAADSLMLQRMQTDAFGRLRNLLSRVGLTDLEGNVRDLIARGITDSDAILFELRDTPTFQTRFKANAARAKKGLPELDPATYVGLEQSFREVLRSNNLPVGFYDENDDFAKLIEGDVSVAELQDRISEGYRKVQDADPEVKRQMQQLYGVGEQELAAYFIDPNRGAVALKRQAQAAQIAARGREQAGLQLTAESAEALAARGITPEEAQARFTERAQLAGLYETMAGEEMLTAEQQLGAAFGYDVAAQQALERRRRQRVAEFQAGGQFARTSGATSGTVETGLGGPQ